MCVSVFAFLSKLSVLKPLRFLGVLCKFGFEALDASDILWLLYQTGMGGFVSCIVNSGLSDGISSE